jgi:signal peptidase II
LEEVFNQPEFVLQEIIMRKYISSIIIFTSTLLADIISKYLVVVYISDQGGYDFLGGFLRISLVYNKGGVFGILQGYKNMFLVVSVIVLVIMLVYFFLEKNKTKLFSISMSLIISGAVGNIIDRLIAGRPGVVDFISLGVDGVYRWPSFNVADAVIIIGAFLLVVVFYKEEKKRKSLEESKNNQ